MDLEIGYYWDDIKVEYILDEILNSWQMILVGLPDAGLIIVLGDESRRKCITNVSNTVD